MTTRKAKAKARLAISLFEVMNEEREFRGVLDRLRGRLVVSCQASEGDPLDDVGTLVRIATSVLRGGAGGLRAEGAERVAAFRQITELPIIGIMKSFDANGDVYITPDFLSAKAVSDAGADIVALDCTARRLNAAEPWPGLIKRIQAELGRPVLADIASVDDAIAAERAGADAVATTLYGYTAETAGARMPSWDLMERLMRQVKAPVVVGSAITRPETITARFVAAAVEAVRQGSRSGVARGVRD